MSLRMLKRDLAVHAWPDQLLPAIQGYPQFATRRTFQEDLAFSRRSWAVWTPQVVGDQPCGWHDLSAQPNRVDPDIGQVEEWIAQIAADYGRVLTSARVEATQIGIEQCQWHPPPTA